MWFSFNGKYEDKPNHFIYLHPSESTLIWNSFSCFSFRFSSTAKASFRCLYSRKSLQNTVLKNYHYNYNNCNYFCAARRASLVLLRSSLIACFAWISLCNELCKFKSSILSNFCDLLFRQFLSDPLTAFGTP